MPAACPCNRMFTAGISRNHDNCTSLPPSLIVCYSCCSLQDGMSAGSSRVIISVCHCTFSLDGCIYEPVPVLFPFPLPEEIILSRNIRLSYFFFYLFNVMSVFFGDGIPGSSRIVISGHRYLLLLNPTLPPGGFCFLGKMSAKRISLNHDTSPYTL